MCVCVCVCVCFFVEKNVDSMFVNVCAKPVSVFPAFVFSSFNY